MGREVPKEVVAGAQEAEGRWGVPASVSIAQWILESNWGQAMPEGSNNPFGIKALPGQPFVTSWTHETIFGEYRKVEQRFAKYHSLAEAFEAHGKLLGSSRYYSEARKWEGVPEKFAMALQGVYATGIPGHPYGEALVKIMRDEGLEKFDKKGKR